MRALFNYFFDLCLLRRGPQDLPYSPELLALTWAAELLVGWFLVGDAVRHPVLALLESLSDTLVLLGVLWLLLRWRGRSRRFVQTATAALGSNALLGVVALPVVVAIDPAPGGGTQSQADWLGLVLLGVVVWGILVLGHILRHALETGLGEGLALSLIYTVFSYLLLGSLFAGG